MESINFVVHLFSGVGFVVIIYLYLVSRKRHRLVNEYLNVAIDPTAKKQLAQEPQLFLKQFCRAFDIPMDQTSITKSEISRIDASPWIRAHLQLGIQKVICSSHADHMLVQVEFRNNNEVSKLNLDKLKASLGPQAEIKLG